VEFPACFVPNFRVVEIQSMKNATQSDFAKAGN
jgi:hypothetical protein